MKLYAFNIGLHIAYAYCKTNNRYDLATALSPNYPSISDIMILMKYNSP